MYHNLYFQNYVYTLQYKGLLFIIEGKIVKIVNQHFL